MWTYTAMWTAARNDRANRSMEASSRRSNDNESPHYGYNVGRPRYRNSRLNGPYGNNQMYRTIYGGNRMATISNIATTSFASTTSTTTAITTTEAASTIDSSQLPSAVTNLQYNFIDDDDNLFDPLAVVDDKDFIPKKPLTNHVIISNINNSSSSTSLIRSDTNNKELILDTSTTPVAKIADGILINNITNRISSIRDDNNDGYHENIEDGNTSGIRNKKLQDYQTPRSKSVFRRTLNALRFRITKRGRAKPPEWFLDKFQTPTAESKTVGSDAPLTNAQENNSRINILCNRLSVDPSLPSHYRWLAIVSLAVLYNIIFVVGRAIFWEINSRAAPLWWFLDYLCDFIYLLDTLVHMHEGYLDQGLLVRDAYKLRTNYFSNKSWCIDLFSMFPTDLAYFWWLPSSCNRNSLPCPVIVRLNRLLRLPRMWEWFDRTETATGYPNAFRICKVVLAILVLIHWNACLYFAISYALGFGTDNWVYSLKGARNQTLQRQYIYSFYWSTLTLTTIGETPTPENDAEYLFVVADFLAGVLIFATIVGNIGSMISNMNVARVEFQNRMDGVKQYMAFRRVGSELEARVIRWFAYTWSQSGALDEERVLAALPDKLKAEIAIRVHMDTLKQVRIFQDCEPGLLEALVLKLKLQVFSPGDYICRKGDVGKEMYIVKRGKLSVVADDGTTVFATLGAGSVFGEVSVLEIAGNRTGNRRTANVRSLGYSDLFCLAKRDLWETLADYPEARATLTERGCQLLRKDGLLDEDIFANSQRNQDSLEYGVEKLEQAVEHLNVRLARLLAEYSASQAKLKQRIAKLELNADSTSSNNKIENQINQRTKNGRLYSLQTKKRRPRSSLSKSMDSKQNTL